MLHLTYQPKEDGLGGQYQRVVGIMALAKKYGITYVHTPIKTMEHLPNPVYLERIENYFQIFNHYANSNDIQYDVVITMERADESKILQLREKCIDSGKKMLLQIFLPQSILDKNPEWYNLITPEIREIKQRLLLPHFFPDKTNIAIHVRRGDVNSNDHPIRFTPIEYYYKIVDHFEKTVPNINICIFSEVSETNHNEFEELGKKKHVRVLTNLDILTTFEYMVCSDILVTSKSSFSYLAGLLNPNSVVYMDFWHSPLNHWVRL
jgi:hypothetical protein